MIIKFHKKFKKRYQKLSAKLELEVDSQLRLFLSNPLEKSLRNHALKGKCFGYRSIDITGDYRAIFRELDANMYLFVYVGTHSELYN